MTLLKNIKIFTFILSLSFLSEESFSSSKENHDYDYVALEVSKVHRVPSSILLEEKTDLKSPHSQLKLDALERKEGALDSSRKNRSSQDFSKSQRASQSLSPRVTLTHEADDDGETDCRAPENPLTPTPREKEKQGSSYRKSARGILSLERLDPEGIKLKHFITQVPFEDEKKGPFMIQNVGLISDTLRMVQVSILQEREEVLSGTSIPE